MLVDLASAVPQALSEEADFIAEYVVASAKARSVRN